MCTILIIAQFFHPFIISTSTCSAIKTKQKVNFTGSLSIFMFMYLWQIHSFRVSQEIILLLIHHRHHRRSISAFLNFIIIENFYFLLCYTLSLSPRFCRRSHHFHQGSFRECGFKHFKQMADKIMIGLSSYSSIQTKNDSKREDWRGALLNFSFLNLKLI